MRKCVVPLLACIILTAAGGCVPARYSPAPTGHDVAPPSPPSSMRLTSPAFGEHQTIPSAYTCDGKNVPPPLSITDRPAGAKTLALIVHDPDAPGGDWLHWTLWNIPAATVTLPEGSIPAGAVEGITDFGKPGYGGPCPPSGTHRYVFEIYALDGPLPLAHGATLADLKAAMAGHILDTARLTGLYKRR